MEQLRQQLKTKRLSSNPALGTNQLGGIGPVTLLTLWSSQWQITSGKTLPKKLLDLLGQCPVIRHNKIYIFSPTTFQAVPFLLVLNVLFKRCRELHFLFKNIFDVNGIRIGLSHPFKRWEFCTKENYVIFLSNLGGVLPGCRMNIGDCLDFLPWKVSHIQ